MWPALGWQRCCASSAGLAGLAALPCEQRWAGWLRPRAKLASLRMLTVEPHPPAEGRQGALGRVLLHPRSMAQIGVSMGEPILLCAFQPLRVFRLSLDGP